MPETASHSPWWRRIPENLLALLLLSMAISFLIQIIWRYVFNSPQGWTVEYVAISWLWGILFGYAFVVTDKEIVRLDVLYNAFSPKGRAIADIVSGTTVVGLLAYSLPANVEFVNFMSIERTAFLQIGFDWVFSIYIPFVVMVMLRITLNVIQAARQLFKPQVKS